MQCFFIWIIMSTTNQQSTSNGVSTISKSEIPALSQSEKRLQQEQKLVEHFRQLGIET